MTGIDVVQEVRFYPVKSMRAATVDGEASEVLDVTETGLGAYDVRDREFVIAEEVEEQGLVVTQRGWDSGENVVHPYDRRLATVHTDVQAGRLILSASGVGELVLPTEYDPTALASEVKVHGNKLLAQDQGDDAAGFASEVLGRRVRMMRASREAVRELPAQFQRPGAVNHVGGADGFPMLLTSQASLKWLLQHQKKVPGREAVQSKDYPLSQYRGNVGINGEAWGAFMEDSVRIARIGRLIAHFVKPCKRCPMPDISQVSGERMKVSPLLLVNRVGYFEGEDDEPEKGMFMGRNINHVYKHDLQVRRGDPVQILAISSPDLKLNHPMEA